MFSSGHCAGLYPVTGQSTYYDNCVGHDEPGIQFYSAAPGSAGNITWNVTLPIDSGPARNQSNLYVAVWFGMTLSDPLAWLDQCFLELQLYPDSTWGAPANGVWIAAAVAWQIESSTGYEDPCYYSPLYNHGNPGLGYLNLSQGDRLTVSMSGWETDPLGESITLADQTSGNVSNLTLFDPYGQFPLNPAYSTNSYENGLQWTPGGEYPAVFAFETGHGRNPDYPSNSTFNYCLPGRPPATSANPYVPCPSYDPASWLNDSRQPWRISVPTFGPPAGTAPPAQVSFSQDFGGINLAQSSPGCPGNEGSEYCSYPWYSYSCSTHTFQFGATDYLGTTADFGTYRQFAATSESNDLGFGYYAPTNFTIPSCGAPTASIGLNGSGTPGGSVYFLSHSYSSPGSVDDLSFGAYSIHAIGGTNARFLGWQTTGKVSVDLPSDAWATVDVSGSGNVTAEFSLAPPRTMVTFENAYSNGTAANASVALLPSYLQEGGGIAVGTYSNGQRVLLSSQIYSILAYPRPADNFTQWTVNNSGAIVAASQFPDSWFVITGVESRVTITAWYAHSITRATVSVSTYGNGTVTVGGTTGTSFSKTLPVGTYSATAHPQSGWSLSYWYAGGSIALADESPSTYFTLENGSASLEPVFVQLPAKILVQTVSPSAGSVSFGAGSMWKNGTTVPLTLGYSVATAVPASGYRFVGWTVNRTASAWPQQPSLPVTNLLVNASVRLTATFASASSAGIAFRIVPPVGGAIEFNLLTYGNGSSNSTAALGGAFAVAFIPSPGFQLSGYSVSGPITFNGVDLTINGAKGVLTAVFASIPPTLCAVTFVSVLPGGIEATLNGTSLVHGDTLWIDPGQYRLTADPLGATSFVKWLDSGSVAVVNSTQANTTVDIAAGGLLIAVGVPFLVLGVSVSPGAVDVGNPVVFHALTSGGSGVNASWSGMPGGCSNVTVTTPDYTCSPARAGSYPIWLNLTDAAGAAVNFGPLSLIVAPPPSITSFRATRTTLTVGAMTDLVMNVPQGSGIPPLRFLYSGLPPGCDSQNASSIVCSPTTAGTSTVSGFVFDVLGLYAQASLLLVVNPKPSVGNPVVFPSPITIGRTAIISVSARDGTGPFDYQFQGLPPGCRTANVSRLACAPTESGTFSIAVRVIDSDGIAAQAATNLTVNAPPTIVAVQALPPSIRLGNSTRFEATATGGTGRLAYAYSALPKGCATSNSSVLSCRPTEAGNFTVKVSVSDTLGVNTSKTIHLEVTSPPNPGPTGTGSAPGFGPPFAWVLAIAVLLAVAAGAVVRWRRRGRRRSAGG